MLLLHALGIVLPTILLASTHEGHEGITNRTIISTKLSDD